MQDILETIKKARESKGWTQSDVAQKLSIGLRQYQNMEAGQFPKFKRQMVSALEEVLGISIYEKIYEGEDEILSELRNSRVTGSLPEEFNIKDSNALKILNLLQSQTDWMRQKVEKHLEDISANLIETRHGVEMNQALSKANLFQSAKLELIGTKPGQWTDEDYQNIVRDLNEVTAKIFLETRLQSSRTNEHAKVDLKA